MPSSEVRQQLARRQLEPTTVFKISRLFLTSVQATARRIVSLRGTKRCGIALWDLRPWPMPVWWTGLKIGEMKGWEQFMRELGSSSGLTNRELRHRKHPIISTAQPFSGMVLLTQEILDRRPALADESIPEVVTDVPRQVSFPEFDRLT